MEVLIARWRRAPGWQLALGLALVAFAVYAPTLANGFVYDDPPAVQQNPVVRGDLPWFMAFARDFWGRLGEGAVNTWRPIPVLSFVLDQHLGGGAAWAFHLSNVLLHAAVVAVAFVVFERLAGRPIAFVATLSFAVLAAPGEAVESIVGRADAWAALFLLLGLHFHRSPGFFRALLAAVFTALAVASKESAAVAPALYFAVTRLAEPAERTRWKCLAAEGFAIAAVLAMRVWAIGAVKPVVNVRANPLVAVEPLERVLGAAHIFLARYVGGLVDPSRRLADCSAWACGPAKPGDPVAWLGLLLLVVLCAAPFLLARRSPVAAAGLAWFVLLFLPVSNLLVVGPTTYGERLLYGPALGLCLALGVGLVALFRLHRPLATLGTAAFLAAQLVVVLVRHGDWRTPETLWLSVVDAAPDGARGLGNLAAVRLDQRRFEEAEALARRSVELFPDSALPHDIRAVALDELGHPAEAEAEFRAALAEPLDAQVTIDAATFFARTGRLSEADAILRRHLAGRPQDKDVRKLADRVAADLAGASARPR